MSKTGGAAEFLKRSCDFTDRKLDEYIPKESDAPQTLHKAMRYSIFAGGKRLRPALVLAAAEAVGGTFEDAAPVACALEMIHTYSLIHDDLPAMDNDDLRRGRPTNHKVFGDAMAILAGDGLLTLAFETLTRCPKVQTIPAVLGSVARGAGCQGMVGGQVLDIEGEGKPANLSSVKAIHQWKTAALIAASCEAGALAAGANLTEAEKMRSFGIKIGLAFQILDDILDCTSSPEQLGKTPGKDQRAGKATYPSIMGLEKAQAEAEGLIKAAELELAAFGSKGCTLRELARFVVERKN
jgi:geranylgeranyl diphosphate synthase type II